MIAEAAGRLSPARRIEAREAGSAPRAIFDKRNNLRERHFLAQVLRCAASTSVTPSRPAREPRRSCAHGAPEPLCPPGWIFTHERVASRARPGPPYLGRNPVVARIRNRLRVVCPVPHI